MSKYTFYDIIELPNCLIFQIDKDDLGKIDADLLIEGLIHCNLNIEMVVFEFNPMAHLYESFTTNLARMVKEKKLDKKLKFAFIGSKSIEKKLKFSGLDDLFPCFPSLQKAGVEKEKYEPSKEKTTLFLNEFIKNVIGLIDQTTGLHFVAQPPYRYEDVQMAKLDLTSSVEITSRFFRGRIEIVFTQDVYLKVISRFLNREFTELNDNILDGTNEILNISLGMTKKSLEDQDFQFRTSFPKVEKIHGMDLDHVYHKGSLFLPFKSELGSLHLVLTTQEMNEY